MAIPLSSKKDLVEHTRELISSHDITPATALSLVYINIDDFTPFCQVYGRELGEEYLDLLSDALTRLNNRSVQRKRCIRLLGRQREDYNSDEKEMDLSNSFLLGDLSHNPAFLREDVLPEYQAYLHGFLRLPREKTEKESAFTLEWKCRDVQLDPNHVTVTIGGAYQFFSHPDLGDKLDISKLMEKARMAAQKAGSLRNQMVFEEHGFSYD